MGQTVDLLDDIEPDGSGEDGREGERAGRLSLGGPDGDGGTGGHLCMCCCLSSVE